MAYKEDEITLSGDIPAKLWKEFDKQTETRKQPKKECLASAVRLWSGLPTEIQAVLMSEECADIYATLCFMIQRSETIKWLESLSPKDRSVVSQLVSKGLSDLSGLETRPKKPAKKGRSPTKKAVRAVAVRAQIG